MIRALAVACLMSLAAGAVATSADAKTIFETATFTGVDTGEYIVEEHTLFRRRLHPGQDDGNHRNRRPVWRLPDGMIFGAIVSLPSATSFPDFTPTTIEANSLAYVAFAAPSDTTDLTEKVDVTLRRRHLWRGLRIGRLHG